MDKEVLYFTSQTCASCKGMKPAFLEECRRVSFTAYRFIDVDEDADAPDLIEQYRIRSLPSLVFKRNDGSFTVKIGNDAYQHLKAFVTA